jgi:uncharacterized protein (TIGR00255 family)
MRSMTGFGIGHAALGSGGLCVELKSLNHRYLDVRVRTPTELSDHSFFLEHLARRRLNRGRFDVQVRIDGPVLSGPRLDVERVRAVYHELAGLRDELSPGSELSLTALAAIPSLYVDKSAMDGETIREAITNAFDDALGRLEEMRANEGARLTVILSDLLERARQLTVQCELRCAESLVGHHERLKERVSRLLEDPAISVDPMRLELEVAVVAERSDAAEELSRLKSHFAMFGELLVAKEPSGRRLDFLLQEIARETNTLGAKSQDATLSHLVVELKAESERMREQVQNVE